MRMLNYDSVKLKKLNKPSTFPFNISSYGHDMIISELLFEKTKPKSCTIIFFFYIYTLVLLKRDIKISVSCVSNRKNWINMGQTTVSNGAKFKMTGTLARFACIKIANDFKSRFCSEIFILD